MFHSVNPTTEKLFLQTPFFSSADIEKALDCSEQAFADWSVKKNKTLYVQALADALKKNQVSLSQLMTQEMGKPIKQARAEIDKSILLCEYTVKHADSFLMAQKHLPDSPKGSYVVYQPLGIILGIMPWNFPVWQVCRFALPTLLGGNTVLIKHAPNVMGCAVQLEKIFQQAGFPNGVYQNLPISVEQTEKIITDRRLRGVSLTGSVKAGRSVSALAGRYLKKTVLELGGSDPYLILDSADVKMATPECVTARMFNNGQSCIAAKRLIVTKKNADYFIDCFLESIKSYVMGDPILPETTLGPLACLDLRQLLQKQVEKLKTRAELLLGGHYPKKKGWFYPPTVLVSRDVSFAKKFQEELFGPVAFIIVVSNEEEGIEVANHSCYGLGSAVFGSDQKRAEWVAREKIQAGVCVVNKGLHSHPALPFGGVKDSGYGRELSQWGFYEFVNIKTIQLG